MDNRREFIKKAAILAGGTGLLPSSIQRALAIDPSPGSTWLDAEHVVILMQENRSFDHCYGMLQGVRGYRDPSGCHRAWRQSCLAAVECRGRGLHAFQAGYQGYKGYVDGVIAPFPGQTRQTRATKGSMTTGCWPSGRGTRSLRACR
ncbi:alkaline phosphatase family protein [Puia sp. P3]|uniref:alkaline phosphatase family protein n=1 Tax=Puia sp. P3 TaxID=3423952 RepID=UPI003D66B8A2